MTCQGIWDFRRHESSATLCYVPRPTTRTALHARLQDATSLPEAVTILRDHYGSDDALAAELGTTRQRTIGWRKGEYPKARYRKMLAEQGVPPHLLIEPVDVGDVWRIALRLEAELAALRQLLEGLGPQPS